MIRIQVDASDTAQARFAADAVWESAASLNVLTFPRSHLLHERLVTRVPADPGFDLQHLLELAGDPHWVPDLFGPTPSTVQEHPLTRLAALAEAPPEVADSDLETIRRRRPHIGAAGITGPEYAERTATAMCGYWTAVLSPLWDRIQAIVRADIEYRTRIVAESGLAGAISGIHEDVAIASGLITISLRQEICTSATGQGVWFVPSVFRWPWVSVDVRPVAPVISYAARGAGRVWETRPAVPQQHHLERLIGRTRTTILAELSVPQTTTALAHSIGLTAATISEHLSVLASSGLVEGSRNGREVRYARTARGESMLRE
ncbi:ArsR/SmtB family transcription factor [Nocardioides speluncae]|uniref:ArsR/SmtB family transcription factor n=1 Tax=Nocardioides speluncae TaxID=2670337 RepID=UPI000D69B450|nr:DUF5937 family protein [Nocardioides speluncae]